jgi:hypothetical protein
VPSLCPQYRHAVVSSPAPVTELASDQRASDRTRLLAASSVRQRRGALQAINGTGAVVELKPEMLISVFPSPGTEKSSAQDGTWTGKSNMKCHTRDFGSWCWS